MNIIQDFIPKGRKNRPGATSPCKYITLHNTGNSSKGANAKAHASYLKSDAACNPSVSWHYTVDDVGVYQHVPDNENAYHTANSIGNGQSIGIEICMNSDGDILKATNNAVELTATLMKKYNIPITNIKQHYDWSGKNCPSELRAGRPYSWTIFIDKVQNYTYSQSTPQLETHIYRVRLSWVDNNTQIGAFGVLNNAKICADENKSQGYKVFDESGNMIYDPNVISNSYHQTALNIISDGITTYDNLDYWNGVFNGKYEVDVSNVITIIDRYHAKLTEDSSVLPPIPTIEKDFKYYIDNGIHIVEIPVNKFRIRYWDKPKKTSSFMNYFNLGYFGTYNESGVAFTLPTANLICDIVENEISSIALKYVKERKVKNGKLYWDCNSWGTMGQMYNKSASTLVVSGDDTTHIAKYNKPGEEFKYAISGAPVIINGKQADWVKDCLPEGWDTSIYRATWHGFLGVKGNTIFYFGLETKTSNCFTGEAFDKLKNYGCDNIIKVDGGGSFCLDVNGKNVALTSENRQINNIGLFN